MEGSSSEPVQDQREQTGGYKTPSAQKIASGTPFTTKAIAFILVCGYLLCTVYPPVAKQLALIPDKTLPSVWNLGTAGFLEMNILVFDVICLLHLGQAVEPYWGGAEFFKFLLASSPETQLKRLTSALCFTVKVVNVCVGTATFLVLYVLYLASADEYYLYTRCWGFQGAIAGLCVAVRQLLPEETLLLVGPAPLRPQGRLYLSLYVTATLLLCISSDAEHHHIGLYLFVIFGAYFGWLYLRFFQ
eukprot:gene3588-4516_t